MSKKILMEDLNKEIMKYLNEYKEDIEEDVVKDATKLSKEAKAELIARSPVGKDVVITKDGNKHNPGDYKRGWTISQQKGKNSFSKKIWNRTNYQLTHLLEFGHAMRQGGRASANPHIRDVEKKYIDKFEKQLTKDISKGD